MTSSCCYHFSVRNYPSKGLTQHEPWYTNDLRIQGYRDMPAKSDRSFGVLNVNRLKVNPCSFGMVLWADITLGLSNLVLFGVIACLDVDVSDR
ncbi:uncharacterized protein EURHEDRAFT_410836 [Aspergillus ruber CBS 135680]|uniref:Uncharacterized protein n=1 Tax=Aspergillus ruber (strain CBS 135680) TaxID=1388766 RepID=A0A017SL97_ASPRC|nr:uncharacterized protein EURHEDRAFT_410836 [Aspergillus ruber CBS 135680]EYE97040.1 hypothetical protein EURHEDRAFT_410836 [Aspergillus ruber CBS 135680]